MVEFIFHYLNNRCEQAPGDAKTMRLLQKHLTTSGPVCVRANHYTRPEGLDMITVSRRNAYI